MTEVIMTATFWLFIVAFVCVTAFVTAHAFSGARRKNAKPEFDEKKVSDFFGPGGGTNKGRLFVDLVVSGFFVAIVPANHSGVFDDGRQLRDFGRFSGKEMAEALKKVGDSHERHYV